MFKYEVTVDDSDSFISKLSGHMTIEDSKIIVSKIKSERKRSRSSSRTSSSQDKDKKVNNKIHNHYVIITLCLINT